MLDWIKKNINPPGINKPRRGALFSVIGKVFGVVRKDAESAFNAHFPYLCEDVKKLEEHGTALRVPHLPHDTLEEYRNRVATASFYHMKVGERGYVLDQLKEHFGDRCLLTEDFLQIYVKILDLSTPDREWVYSFLDSVLNPAIALGVAEWFQFVENMTMTDSVGITAHRPDVDVFPQEFAYNGRFLCDQGIEILCNGRFVCDGSWLCNYFMPARGTVFDTIKESIYPDGSLHCDGSFDCSGYIGVYLPIDVAGPVTPVDTCADRFSMSTSLGAFEDQAVITAICDGSWLCDGSNRESMIDAPMTLRVIRPFRCDGSKTPSCSTCDGSIICDGSYTGFDGWYYSGDLIQEECL